MVTRNVYECGSEGLQCKRKDSLTDVGRHSSKREKELSTRRVEIGRRKERKIREDEVREGEEGHEGGQNRTAEKYIKENRRLRARGRGKKKGLSEGKEG